MKSFAVIILIFAIGSVAQASQVRFTCKATQGRDSIWAMSVDSAALSSPGRYQVKVDGLYFSQTLETLPNGSFSFHHQNGSNEVIVPVSSPAEAAAAWQATNKSDSGSLAPLEPSQVGHEFESADTEKSKHIYLKLFRNSETDGFSYGGFCKLSIKR